MSECKHPKAFLVNKGNFLECAICGQKFPLQSKKEVKEEKEEKEPKEEPKAEQDKGK